LTLPNFIVIGAAKAGTTALYWYLAEHPAVFMSPVKETNYFAYGLDDEGRLLWGDPEVHRFPVKSLSEYQELFAEAGDALAVGEASTMYLECPQSAARIRELLPATRIICGHRDPVERVSMPSLAIGFTSSCSMISSGIHGGSCRSCIGSSGSIPRSCRTSKRRTMSAECRRAQRWKGS
jgi:hypothetical protein